ncbi:hypothetical protein JCM2811A_13090 [Methylorubrum rhodinum]
MLWSGLSEKTLQKIITHCLENDPAPKTHHITRFAMYKALSGVLAEHDSEEKTCLGVSTSKNLAKIIGLNAVKFTSANYPEYNIMKLPFENEQFDFVITDQVFEHIEGSPIEAFKECNRVLKPGGYAVHTTCFLQFIHGAPSDFWRYTPNGLRFMATDSGCEVILADGWGNREVWPYINLGFRTAKIPDNPKNPIYQLAMRNEPACPYVVWIVARKP